MRKSNFGMLTEFMLGCSCCNYCSNFNFNVNADARDDLVADSHGYNATLASDAAIAKVPANLSL